MTGNDLLYVAGGVTDKVYVFSYPGGTLSQTLTGLQNPNGECVDGSGNVYITQSSGNIAEYAHGGSSPINTISGADASTGCSVDQTTGNLAAVTGNGLSVWPNGQGPPTPYTNPGVTELYCGYDSSGNLFIDGRHNEDFVLSELPKGGSSIVNLSLSLDIRPGQVQWDGSYVAVGDSSKPGSIYQIQASGSSATVVGETTFDGIKSVGAFWIDNGTVVIPLGVRRGGPKQIGYWSYPQGGKAAKVLKKFNFGRRFMAAAISPG